MRIQLANKADYHILHNVLHSSYCYATICKSIHAKLKRGFAGTVAKSQQSEEHASLQFIQGELKCDHSYAQYKMTLKVFFVKKVHAFKHFSVT